MSYQVFARKYRPQSFSHVLGQDHVVQTLRNAIEQDRLAHAYLFVGPRGTGKTSTARIFAKALNCPEGPTIDFDPTSSVCQEIAEGINLDVLEIDGATNNGVDQVRELRETVKFAPASGRFKIYYIDEVHMLSTAAFNALLKTLEEPPPHVKFIFATTEPNKILPTIISRCQRFDLRRIPTQIIADHLLYIAKEENVKLDENAAFAIAKGADGGMRDAQSMLDQLVAFCGEHIAEENVLEIFGFTSLETISNVAQSLLDRNTVFALETVHQQSENGKDLTRFLADLIAYVRNLLIAIVDPKNEFGDLAPELRDKLYAQIKLTNPERLLKLIDHFADAEAKMKWAPNKKLHLEVAVIKAMQILTESTLSDVIGLLHQAGQAANGLPTTAGTATVQAIASTPAPIPASAPPPPAKAAPAKKKSAAVKKNEPAQNEKVAASPPPEPAPQEAAPAPVAEPKPAPVAIPAEAPATSSEAPAETPPQQPEEFPDEEPRPTVAPKIELPPVQAKPTRKAAKKVVSGEADLTKLAPQNLEGQALWEAVRQEISNQKPFMSSITDASIFLGLSGNKFSIGLPTSLSLGRDSLMGDKSRIFIEELLQHLGGGSPYGLIAEVHASVPEPEIEDEPEPEPLPEPAAPKPQPAPKAQLAPEPKEAETKPEEPEIVEPEPPVDEEEFRKDGLIKDAMRIFEAERES